MIKGAGLEEAILGAIINNKKALKQIAGVIKHPKYFRKQNNRIIYATLLDLNVEDVAGFDELLIGNALKKAGKLKKIGGYTYLSNLAECASTTSSPRYLAKLLIEEYCAAKMVNLHNSFQGRVKSWLDGELQNGQLTENFSLNDQINDALVELKNLQSLLITEQHTTSLKEEVPAVYKDIYDILENRKPPALKTGIPALDRIIGGFVRSEYNLVAARPSVGKSSFALNIAVNVMEKHKVLIFSLEVPKLSIIRDRMIQIIGRVPMGKLRKGENFTAREYDRLGSVFEKLSRVENLRLNANPSITIGEIETIARAQHESGGLDFLIIDYGQLIRNENQFERNHLSLANISKRLKALGQELNLYTLFIYQLNRDSDKGQRAPRLSDLGESGQIDRDADVAILLHETTEMIECGQLEGLVVKNKNGSKGKAIMNFDRKYTRFEGYGEDIRNSLHEAISNSNN